MYKKLTTALSAFREIGNVLSRGCRKRAQKRLKRKKMRLNLHMSKKSSNFARNFDYKQKQL